MVICHLNFLVHFPRFLSIVYKLAHVKLKQKTKVNNNKKIVRRASWEVKKIFKAFPGILFFSLNWIKIVENWQSLIQKYFDFF